MSDIVRETGREVADRLQYGLGRVDLDRVLIYRQNAVDSRALLVLAIRR